MSIMLFHIGIMLLRAGIGPNRKDSFLGRLLLLLPLPLCPC